MSASIKCGEITSSGAPGSSPSGGLPGMTTSSSSSSSTGVLVNMICAWLRSLLGDRLNPVNQAGCDSATPGSAAARPASPTTGGSRAGTGPWGLVTRATQTSPSGSSSAVTYARYGLVGSPPQAASDDWGGGPSLNANAFSTESSEPSSGMKPMLPSVRYRVVVKAIHASFLSLLSRFITVGWVSAPSSLVRRSAVSTSMSSYVILYRSPRGSTVVLLNTSWSPSGVHAGHRSLPWPGIAGAAPAAARLIRP